MIDALEQAQEMLVVEPMGTNRDETQHGCQQ